MKTPRRRQLCSLSLSLLLFLPAMPVLADGDSTVAGAFDLHLAEALALQGSTLPLDSRAAGEGFGILLDGSGEGGAAQEIRFAEIGPRSGREVAWQVSEQQAEADPADQLKPKKKGVGRWLKKHWYVPALAAVAIGFALADSGDNDAMGEED